jgi:hypothetical protein
MRYKQKENIVDAIQFKYIASEIENLKDFIDGYVCKLSKARCPDAKAKLELQYTHDNTDIKLNMIEGEWLIKTKDNIFKTCSNYMFEALYEEI